MKSIKKIVSIILSTTILMSLFLIAPISTNAAQSKSSTVGTSGVIYFDYGTKLKDVKQIYCHIWELGGDEFFGWQTGGEKCTKEGPTTWSYDLSKLKESIISPGGLKSGVDYCLIFSADSGMRTYDMTFGTPCIGDTVKLTNNMIESPLDSEKKSYEAVWETNGPKFGPHLTISSMGNIIGSVLAPGENSTYVIGDWLYAYYNAQTFDVVSSLANALKKFNVRDIDAIHNYIKSKDDTLSEDVLDFIEEELEEAYAKAYGYVSIEIDKTTLYRNTSTTIKAFGGSGKPTFKSSNPKVVKVSSKGKVTALKKGKATITVKYNGMNKRITITVKNPALNYKKVTLTYNCYRGVKLKVIGGTGQIKWKSSNPKVASVNKKGLVMMKKAGSATITATRNGITMKCKVKCKNYLILE